MHDAHDPYAVLRVPDYRCFLGGGILASIGSEIQAVTVLWEIYDRTRSKAAIGYAGLAMFLPVLLLSLPAGHTADRFSRKGQFLFAQAVMLLSTLGLALLSWREGPIPLIYVCLFGSGMSRAFSAPARGSMLPQIIPMSQIRNAVTWSTSGFHVANVTGPALGGLVYALGSADTAYMLSALCTAACMGLFVLIHPTPSSRSVELPSLQSLLAGVVFVWKTKLLLAAITLDLFAVLLGGATALLPVFARDILHVGPVGAGWLRAAPALGALTMEWNGMEWNGMEWNGMEWNGMEWNGMEWNGMAHWPIHRHSGPALLLAVAGFGGATIIFGMSNVFWLSLVMLALTGALDNVSVVIRHTLVQVVTPEYMRGRVAAVNLVFISSSNELGAFESGMTAEWFGTEPSVIGGGIGTVLVVLAVIFCWPQIWKLGVLHGPADRSSTEITANVHAVKDPGNP